MKTRFGLAVMLIMAFALPIGTMMVVTQIGLAAGGPQSRPEGPCDIYNAAGFPCVTAHSTTRALSATYNGPLYQVTRESDGETLDIGIVPSSGSDAGGYADAAAQDAFCGDGICLISIIYDQSGNNNHLYQAPPGTFNGPAKGGFNTLPIADMAPITIGGHKAYGVYIMPGMGLRNNNAAGLAINDEPQGIYMVFDGTHFDSGCCFNYGNTSTNSTAVGRGTMDTVYFGTATAWGSGEGPGPWIMSDMEAGLFSGYNAKQNVGSPTIDSWRFVTGSVNGGGGNQWEIWGGNAQEGELTNFYKGERPGSRENNNYFPMHRKGAVQMGNGGDNGNGSAGTFYEGVITAGYPTEDVVKAVHANIVAARYNVSPVHMSRLKSFPLSSEQEVTVTFTNTTDVPAEELTLSIIQPEEWKTNSRSINSLSEAVAPGATVKVTLEVAAGLKPQAGILTAKAEWTNGATGEKTVATTTQRVRTVNPVKMNEVRLSTSSNVTDQFIELYNAGEEAVDISGWTLTNTKSEWAPVTLATVPAETTLEGGDFYLLGLASSGLVAPAQAGDSTINVRSIYDFAVGQEIKIGSETITIDGIGTAASPLSILFIPVSTGPWLTFPVGTTNLPVTNATGFVVGEKIGIDAGGNYEVATVTEVGTPATQTTLSVATTTGETSIKLGDVSNLVVGDILTIDTGDRKEVVEIASIDAGSTDVELTAPLKQDHILAVDVSCPGSGITFSPATKYPHKSGDAVQALGSGITLNTALENDHEYGASVVNPQVTSAGYQGSETPDLWYGGPLSTSAGSIALVDTPNDVVVDAMIYGSQQSSSSANGTIASPELAILEGDQSQGGCIVVAPSAGRGFGRFAAAGGETNRSLGRFPDGADEDSNCTDFKLQTSSSLALGTTVGSNNIKVASVADYSVGQTITIGTGEASESVSITSVGTAGGTTVSAAIESGATEITVASTAGFSVGQTITLGTGENAETAIIASISGGRRGGFGGGFGGGRGAPSSASITVNEGLTHAHEAGEQVAGSGLTLAAALTKAYDSGAQISNGIPTPGAPNQY